MNRRWQLAFGLALTGLAGYVDALGFIRLGGLYTSFMSGNTTQLSVALGQGAFAHAVLPGTLLLTFALGAILGGGLSALTPPRFRTMTLLAFETLLLLAALSMGLSAPDHAVASLFMALAMGMQNAVLAQVQGFRAGATFITGALFSFGQKFAQALAGRGSPYGWVGDGAVWLALTVGAFLGALAYGAFALYALVGPAVLAAILAVVAGVFAAVDRPVLSSTP